MCLRLRRGAALAAATHRPGRCTAAAACPHMLGVHIMPGIHMHTLPRPGHSGLKVMLHHSPAGTPTNLQDARVVAYAVQHGNGAACIADALLHVEEPCVACSRCRLICVLCTNAEKGLLNAWGADSSIPRRGHRSTQIRQRRTLFGSSFALLCDGIAHNHRQHRLGHHRQQILWNEEEPWPMCRGAWTSACCVCGGLRMPARTSSRP